MNSARRGYAKEYTIEEVPGKNGKTKRVAVYRGAYYRFSMEERAFSTLKKLLLAIPLAETALYLLLSAGAPVYSLAGVDGQGIGYVMLPFLLLLLPVAMCVAKAAGFYRLKQRLTHPEYDQYVVRFRNWCVAMLVFAAAAAIGQLVWLATHLSQAGWADYTFFVCMALAAGGAFLLRKIQDRYPCEPEKTADKI